MIQRYKIANDHAETVKQGGWIAYRVFAGNLERLSYVKAIVENIMVA